MYKYCTIMYTDRQTEYGTCTVYDHIIILVDFLSYHYDTVSILAGCHRKVLQDAIGTQSL